MDIKDQVVLNKIPEHIAVIMDGNGRWARKHGKPRVFGHKNGVQSVREITEAAAEIGVRYLTLYAFSTENWSRPKLEVNALMGLLVETIHKEVDTLNRNNIRLKAIGEFEKLPPKTCEALKEGMEETRDNTHMDLILALNYSSRWEISNAVQNIVSDVIGDKINAEDISESLISNYLATHFMPDPELLIRTSGEKRLSNFLLWQSAYTEFYFTEKMWPEFRKEDFYSAVHEFQNRERRFGKTSDQIV
ncbi:isoprenyl transferase [Membranihabitans maritimus]|uniref:isoprenyl transferase n=1 Tax=Membranihabitans maritimus TaxID=2904244 RepID=UPI001F0143A6|nr:isoprenyl transferase [Membranihabitans maritimus]